MNPITHALVGWCVAESVPGLGKRERALVVGAAVAPDLDGLGIVPELVTRNGPTPLLWWSSYHHVLAHNLAFSCLVAVLAGVLATTRRTIVALLAFIAVQLHFLCDVVGSRGPDGYEWPIPYFYPFAARPEISWSGQWRLNAWPNILITIVLLGVTFVLAWRRGYSPVGLFSERADRAFVGALRARFGQDVATVVEGRRA
jgi:inner membrane protein